MIHLGDITKISGFDVPTVDIITGGSPCQDLSVAGKRAGLAGERSGLFMEQIRIIKEMREKEKQSGKTNDTIRPRYMVWENVPGAFSSNKGEDFRAVLEETAKVADKDAVIPGLKGGQKWTPSGCIMGDGWSIAWRLHDAQFWGVPQRRKRIALVADFGGATAPEILFECNGMSGDIETSREKREGTATDAERGTSQAIGFNGWQSVTSTMPTLEEKIPPIEATMPPNVYCLQGNGIDRADTAGCNGKGWRENESYTLNTIDRPAVCYKKQGHPQNAEQGQGWEETNINDTLNAFDNGESRTPTVILENHPADSRVKICEDGVFQTLSSRMGTGGGNVPMVMEKTNIFTQQRIGEYSDCGVASSIKQRDFKDATDLIVGSNWDGQQVSPTLTQNNANGSQRMPDKENFNAVITYGLDRAAFNQGKNAKFDFSIEEEKIGAQVARGPGAVCQSIVRRLTPLECERLQGYPDHWTDIGEWIDSKGKKHKDADSPRYKALGNSIALPFWKWMADRMVKYLDIEHATFQHHPTMASLFDGIGGFPLVFSWVGCEPVWASEIEEFPIAVTKIRFGEN